MVWKFELLLDDEFTIEMPAGAEVVHVREQDNRPCLWVLVDPDAPKERRTFRTRGTGQDATDAGRYLGSYQLHNGTFVGHLFCDDEPLGIREPRRRS